MITCVGFRSSGIRIEGSEVIIQIKTGRQEIIIHSSVGVIIQVKTRCQGMITRLGFMSSETRTEGSEVIFQIKTGRRRIMTHGRVEIGRSSEDKMSGNDNMCWIRI